MIQIKNYEKAKQFFFERMYCWFRIKTVGKKSNNNPNGHACNCIKDDICNYHIYNNCNILSDDFKDENILKKILQSKPNELVNLQFNFNQNDAVLILKGYQHFRSTLAVEFLKMLDLNTCPYCNKEYLLNVDIPKNTDSARVLVEFDHWLPKSIYKYYSCSFYNLIPVCHNCNHIKSNNNPDKLETYYHPYESFDNLNFQFSYFYHDLYNEVV